MLQNLGHSENDIVITYDEKSNTYWFALKSSDARLLLGRDAEALAALNHLAAKINEKVFENLETRPRVMIDVNDFEKKKIDNLKTIAHMMAERARYFKSSIAIDAMNARDRRIIHEFLSEMSDIKTESEGNGPERHIVIKYVEK